MARPFARTFAALLLTATGLSACATAMDGASQDIRIEIAGTGEALCDVTQPGRRYRVYAPGTMRVMRSGDDLKVRCLAPGNRELTVVLKSQHSDKEVYNVSNGYVPGLTWDYLSGALYTYPDNVVMDFKNIPPRSYPEPDYQAVFERSPELMGLEQFRPGKAALGSDMGSTVPSMKPRDPNSDSSSEIMMPSVSSGTSTAGAPDKSSTPKAAALPAIQPPVALTPAQAPGVVAAPGTTSTNPSQTSTSPSTSSSSSSSSTHIFTNKIGTMPGVTNP